MAKRVPPTNLKRAAVSSTSRLLEPLCNRVRVAAAGEDRHNVYEAFCNDIVDGVGKLFRQFAVQAVNNFLDAGLPLEANEVAERAVGKVIAEPLTLLIVKQRAADQILAGFNPKLDAHRWLKAGLLRGSQGAPR